MTVLSELSHHDRDSAGTWLADLRLWSKRNLHLSSFKVILWTAHERRSSRPDTKPRCVCCQVEFFDCLRHIITANFLRDASEMYWTAWKKSLASLLPLSYIVTASQCGGFWKLACLLGVNSRLLQLMTNLIHEVAFPIKTGDWSVLFSAIDVSSMWCDVSKRRDNVALTKLGHDSNQEFHKCALFVPQCRFCSWVGHASLSRHDSTSEDTEVLYDPRMTHACTLQ